MLFLWRAIAQSRHSSEKVKSSTEGNQLRDFLLLISLGITAVLCTVLVLISELLGQGLLARSLKQFSSTFVAIVMLLEPFFTAIFAYFIFSEQLSLMN